MAALLSPVTRAVLLLPSVAVAVLLSPLTNALLWSPPVAVAILFSPLAIATEPCPSEVAVVGGAFLYPRLTVGRHAHILSVALTVPRLGRRRPWRRGQPRPDTQRDC